MAFIYSHIPMPGGQFSHFRDKMGLARETGHRGSIPGWSWPIRDSWQSWTCGSPNCRFWPKICVVRG